MNNGATPEPWWPQGPTLTAHATVRLRQRGIDPGVLDCLVRYGHHEHDHRGGVVVVFDRTSLEAIRRHESPALVRVAEDARSVYAVVGSGGQVITAGHRFRRVIRDPSISNYRPRRRHARL